VDVTGFTGITLAANTTYKVELFGLSTAAASSTFALRLNSSQNLGLSSGFYPGIQILSSVQPNLTASSATAVNLGSRAGSYTSSSCGCIFALQTGTSAPTVSVQIANSGTAGNTVSLLANSTLQITKIA
jgi:hypothetical protein